MPGRIASKLLAVLPRVPVPALGVLIVVSSLQASCSGTADLGAGASRSNDDAGDVDAAPLDGSDSSDADTSLDSADDRADGMRYGDAYGP